MIGKEKNRLINYYELQLKLFISGIKYMVEIIAFIIAWIFFYYILTYRQKRAPAIKATIIALLFTGLFYSFMNKVYTRLDNNPTTRTISR